MTVTPIRPHPCVYQCRDCKACICEGPERGACVRCLKLERVVEAKAQRDAWESSFQDPAEQFVASQSRIHRRDCHMGPGVHPRGDIVLDPVVDWMELFNRGYDRGPLYPELLNRVQAEALKVKRCAVCSPAIAGPAKPTATLICDVCSTEFIRAKSPISRLTCSPRCASLRRVRQALRKELTQLRDGTPAVKYSTSAKPGDPETLAALSPMIEQCLALCAAEIDAIRGSTEHLGR